ncbi:hypothetical protein U91I_00248 [alpha proteobacterium U9-1i]|nr:hypothetical protein U91I_00248 [alpha proteobacterium U9-1i]
MPDGIDTVLWVAGIAFVICTFMRSWWVAGLVSAAAIAMGWQLPLQTLLIGALAIGLPAFGGTTFGKFLKHRSADPFDPTDARGPEA